MKIYSKDGILLAEVAEAPYSGAFMGERFVSCTVKSEKPIDFLVDDYVDFRNERFVLDYTPTAKKISSAGSFGEAFQYELKFVSLKHELEKCAFLDVVLNDNEIHYTGLSDVHVFGDARVLANRILANLNRLYKGENQWTIEVLKETDAQNISLSQSNCWDALSQMNSVFGLNFTVVGRDIKVGTAGKLVDHVFEYGSGKGLTDITRTAVSGDAVVTRLRAYGGSRNLPRDYNKTGLVPESQYITKLMLPGYTGTLVDYIDSENISIYGIREAEFNDENIYPSIYGVTADDLKAAGVSTTAVGRIDEIVYTEPIQRDDQATFNVWIKDIGFDINKQLTPTTALLSMRDGNLGGYEFEITRCITDTSKSVEINGKTWVSKYKLTLNRNQDDNFVLPDIKTFIKTGDHFVLLEIYMPDVYVKAAEQRLLTRAKEYLAEYDHVKATYSINMDKVFMAYHPTIGDTIYEGDLIRVVDADLKLDREIIIQNLNIKTGGSVPEYEVTLSDDPVATTLDRVQDNISDIEQNVTANKVDGIKEARRRAIELQLLKSNIFDPDGGIKDTFLQAMMLQVGATSMNYQMGKTTARPKLNNMSFTNTTINLGADDVIHFALGAGEESASTWHIDTPFVSSGLIFEKTYFVAIKASRDNLYAEWIVDENTYGFESEPGYYIFNFGILSAVTEGKRFFSETRGNIYAYGDELSAGLISSIDRYSWFNLNTGDFQLYNKNTGQGLQFKGGILTLGTFNPETGKFNSSISQIENDTKEALDTAKKTQEDLSFYEETTNQTLETLNIITDDLQSQVDGNIMSFDGDYFPTLSNYPANEWLNNTEKARHKGDYFDRTFTQEGQKVTERYKFVLDGGVYQWVQIADSSSALALQEAREALGIAGTKAKLFYGDAIPTAPYDINDAWWKINGSTLLSNAKRLEGFGQLESDWKLVNDAQSRLIQIASDDVISKEEKSTLRNEKSQIDKEFSKYQQDAATYGVPITLLQNAYNALVNFLNGTVKISDNIDFTFSGLEQKSQYNQLFADYYTNKTSFSNEIAKKISDTAVDNVQIGGTNYFPIDSAFWEQFGINVGTGLPGLSGERIRTKGFIEFSGTSIAVKNYNSKYALIVFFYRSDKTYINDTYIILGNRWIDLENTIAVPADTKYIRYTLKQNLAGNVNPESTTDRKFMIESGNKYSDFKLSTLDIDKQMQENINYGRLFVRGTGFNNNAGRLVILNNNDQNIAAPGRGLNLITINRYSLNVVDNIVYDTFGFDDSNLINKLTTLSSDVIVVLTSYDEASSKWTDTLTDAIGRCGGFGVKPKLRVPYAFVGIPGIGMGNGLESITQAGVNSPYAEISTQIISGVPVGINIGKSDIAINAKKEAAKAILDAVSAQEQSNTAIQSAQKAENDAAAAEKKAEESKDESTKALNAAKDALIAAENLNFLKSAFGHMTTDVLAGALLSGMIGVKDNAENVVAGVTGIVPATFTKYPMIFAGATNAANANNAKFIVYKDGTLICKNIIVTGGKLAGFDVFYAEENGILKEGQLVGEGKYGRIIMSTAEASSPYFFVSSTINGSGYAQLGGKTSSSSNILDIYSADIRHSLGTFKGDKITCNNILINGNLTTSLGNIGLNLTGSKEINITSIQFKNGGSTASGKIRWDDIEGRKVLIIV